MPMIFLTEPQRQWLERLAETNGPPWLLQAVKREDPKRRGLPESHWRGTEKLK